MVRKITEFFKNLPRKHCTECGKEMEEQHESYINCCYTCLSNKK